MKLRGPKLAWMLCSRPSPILLKGHADAALQEHADASEVVYSLVLLSCAHETIIPFKGLSMDAAQMQLVSGWESVKP